MLCRWQGYRNFSLITTAKQLTSQLGILIITLLFTLKSLYIIEKSWCVYLLYIAKQIHVETSNLICICTEKRKKYSNYFCDMEITFILTITFSNHSRKIVCYLLYTEFRYRPQISYAYILNPEEVF